jgi:hypothetical protein
MPLRDYFWCTLVAINGVFLFTDSGALLFTDHTRPCEYEIFAHMSLSTHRIYIHVSEHSQKPFAM